MPKENAIELGYRLRKPAWNKGYTTEVAQALIDKSFAESQIHQITAWALVENKASTRVMEKVGLKLQQEYIVTAEMIRDQSLMTNPLIKNLLDRTLVKYELNKATETLASN